MWGCGRQLLARRRPAEEEALNLVAPFRQQHLQLLVRLDTFRQNRDIQAFSKCDDRPDECLGLTAFQFMDETFVELDLVERERA
ncbi:hypothetical protein D3C80_1855040 [compost metagenome]